MMHPPDYYARETYVEDRSGAAMAVVFLAGIAAIVLLVAMLAWAPWNNDRYVTPGQGGSDQPVRQQPAPSQPQNPIVPGNPSQSSPTQPQNNSPSAPSQ